MATNKRRVSPAPAISFTGDPVPLNLNEYVNTSFVQPEAPTAPEPEGRTVLGTMKDVGISALKGVIAVPEAAVGLADLVTGGAAGQALESVGFRPREAKAMLDEGYSAPQKEAFRRVQAAEGLGNTFMEAISNPSVIGQSVVESLPLMGAGGVVARGAMAVAPKIAPVVAAAGGEGAVMAGSAAEQIRQQTADGRLTAGQAGLAAATGVVGAGFGLLGGKVAGGAPTLGKAVSDMGFPRVGERIAKGLGVNDVDTLLAGAAKASPAAQKSLVRRVLEGAVTEGVLEELPQSLSEQVLQNMALNKPLDEGLDQAAVLGLLSGTAMGGGANLLAGRAPTPQTEPPPPAPPPVAPPLAAVSPLDPTKPAGPLTRAANVAAATTLTGQTGADLLAIPDNPLLAGARVREEDRRQEDLSDKAMARLEQLAADDLQALNAARFEGQSKPVARATAAPAAMKNVAPEVDPGDIYPPEPGDILNPKGEPFKNKAAALTASKKFGGQVVQVMEGWAVRGGNKESANVGTAVSAATVASGSGGQLGADAAGGQRDRGRDDAGSGGGTGDATPAAARRSQPGEPVRTAGLANPALTNEQNAATRPAPQGQAPQAEARAATGGDEAQAPAKPAAAGPAAVEGAGVGKFDSLEDALTKERDGTTSEIESGWMDGKGRRQQTAIERAVYDAVTASVLDADAAAGIVETALKEGRADLALYAAQRAARAAESMSTTPGVIESSPKYEAIKNDLVKRKQKAQADAQTLIEKAAKGAAPATAPKTGDTITADGKPAANVPAAVAPGIVAQARTNTTPPDFLEELFGTQEQQDSAQAKYLAEQSNRKTALQRIRDEITRQKERATAEYADWESRQYKANKTQVDLRGDGPSNQASMSIGSINESRRRNAMDALAKELAEIDKLAAAASTDSGAENIFSNLTTLREKAAEAVKSGNWPNSTEDSMFESMLLDALKFRGPAGKGNVTSNGLSKAMLAAIKGDATNLPTQAQAGLPAKGAGDTRPAPTAAPEPAGPFGRDMKPVAQGGKPFKTKAEADAFRKANSNNMRTVKSGKGFALRELTPKELAAREKAAKRIAQPRAGQSGVPISAHAFIADRGGLARDAMADAGFDRNMKVGNRWLFAGTGKPGLTLAEAAELLAEAGYIREESEAAAAEIIKRSIRTPQYTAEGWERIAEAEQATRFEDHLAAQQEAATDEDPFGPAPAFTPAEVMVVPKSAREEYAALMDAAEAAGIDTESVLEEAARIGENWTQEQFNEHVRQTLEDAVAGRSSEPAEETGAGQGREDAERGGTEGGSQDAGGQGAQEGLTAPTQADVLAQQDRAAQAEELDQRAQIDREASGFQLQTQTAEQRRENTGDTFGGPSVEDYQAAVERNRKPGTAPEGPDLFGAPEQPDQERFAAGNALTKDQRQKVLGTLTDVYKTKNAPREQKGIGRDGNERYGYVYSPELFEKSDITGAMVRYYVTMPDGKIAHPSELFPDYTQSDIDAELDRRRIDADNKRQLVRSQYAPAAQQFDSVQEAGRFWDDKSDESLRRHGQWRTILPSLERTTLSNGDKFIMVPDATMNDQAMVEAFADEGWTPWKASAAEPAKPASEMSAAELLRAAADKMEAAEKAPAKEATPAEPINTENAGAELTANKRNRIRTGIKWSDIADKDAALRVSETNKANVYPRPDYEAMVEGGMQPIIAHLVKQAYDSLATGPQTGVRAPTDADLQTYIDGVQRYMDGVMKWANDPAAVRAWAGKVAGRAAVMLGASRGVPTSLSAMTESQDRSLLATVYPGGWKESVAQVRMIGGNKALAALQPSTQEATKALKDMEKGWPGKTEAWQKQGYTVVQAADLRTYAEAMQRTGKAPYVSALIRMPMGGRTADLANKIFDGLTSRDDPQVQTWLAQNVAALDGKFLLLDKYRRLVSASDTEDAAKEKARERTKRDGKTTVSDKGISVTAAEREGVQHRMEGEDISSDRLKDTFGFKGVNFGNWMLGKANEKERQLHLNHAFDSFMDLAQVLEVPPKALSLDGMLGLAIGAQGTGKYAAHFVPGVNEINLTRTSGAGSLAHEFGHALDHYFARQAGLVRMTDPYLTEYATRPVESDRVIDGNNMKVKTFGEDIRPEIVQAFKSIVQAMNQRQTTPEETALKNKLSLARAQKSVDGWLASIRKDFEIGRASCRERVSSPV